MSPITLNDGTFLYTEDSVVEYLISCGFDRQDINQLKYIFAEDEIEDAVYYKDCYKEEEQYSSGLYENLNSFANEVEDLANELATGKGGTKIKYAQWFKDLVRQYQP